MRKFVAAQGIALEYSEAIAPARGVSSGGNVILFPGLSPAEEFATLAHELAHEMMHRAERRTSTTKCIRETEAEAVAFVVCSAIGLDTGTAAQDYIGLRATDEKMRLLEDAVSAYERTLKITRNKYEVGVAARSDIITAQTQLDSTRAQLIAVEVTRAQFEHAIAVLVGKPPAAFSLARTPQMGLTLPDVPPQLESTLLERRPDVASAERLAKAANARIASAIRNCNDLPSVVSLTKLNPIH